LSNNINNQNNEQKKSGKENPIYLKIKEEIALKINRNINDEGNKILDISVVELFLHKIKAKYQLCCGRKKNAKKKKQLDDLKGLGDSRNNSNRSSSNFHNKGNNNISDKENSEIYNFKMKNNSMKNLKNALFQKASKKQYIYANYPIFEINLNKYFDVFNYLKLMKDVKSLKAILLGQRIKLLDFIKPKFEFEKKLLTITDEEYNNEELGLFDDNHSNFINENLWKILIEQQKLI